MPVRLDHITPNQFGYQKTEDRRRKTEVEWPLLDEKLLRRYCERKPIVTDFRKAGPRPKAQGERKQPKAALAWKELTSGSREATQRKTG